MTSSSPTPSARQSRAVASSFNSAAVITSTCSKTALRAMIDSATSTSSGSTRDRPIGFPAANKKVLAIPPPTTIVSAISARLRNVFNLVDTLEPPTMATNGRCGFSSTRASTSSSADKRGPAHASSANSATAWVDAWAR